MQGELPIDIVFQILLRLPVKSILRFKSVCKLWRGLIESSSFINQQQQRLNLHHCLIALEPYHAYDCAGNLSLLVFADDDDVDDMLVPAKHVLHSPTFPRYKFRDCVVDMVTCDGIVCLQIYSKYDINRIISVHLWNPLTTQLRALPQPASTTTTTTTTTCSHGSWGRGRGMPDLGFGIDVKTNDYKVVRILTCCNRVEVYSSTTDSWRETVHVLPFDFVISNPNTPYRNGTYCWLGRSNREHFEEEEEDDDYDDLEDGVYSDEDEYHGYYEFYNNIIGAFDFSTEVFETMPLPDVITVKRDCAPQLAIVRDNLTCIVRVDDGKQFEIWMLNEYGVKESWTKLCKVGPFTRIPEPKGLSRDGEFFFFVLPGDPKFCIYNLVTHGIKKLLAPWSLEIAFYKESLVSVQGGNVATIQSACIGRYCK